MRKISVSEFRTNCSAVFRSVAQTRTPVLITRDGNPLVVIRPVPIGAAEEERRRAELEARDLEILNHYADELNAQALEGLEHQAELPEQYAERRKQKRLKRR